MQPPATPVLDPENLSGVVPEVLLEAAARGLIGLDHRLLKAVVSRLEEFLPLLISAPNRYPEAPVDLELLIIDLFRYQPRTESIPFFIDYIRRHQGEIEDEVIDALCRLGEPAIEPLLQLYGELAPEQREGLAFALAALPVKDPRVLELILDRLRQDPEEGSFLLEVFGDPTALPRLQAALEQIDPSEEQLRQALESAIERLRHASPPAPPEPFDIWSEYPERAAPAFHALSLEEHLNLLSSPSAEIRRLALENLSLSDVEKEDVSRRLLELAQSDPDAAVRGEAWKALGLATENKEIMDLIWRRLRDMTVPLEERAGALVGSAHSSEPALRSFILELYEQPQTRPAALEAMWRSMDRWYRDYIQRHLDDPDLACRKQAILGVGMLRLHSEMARLERLFEDEEVRTEALYAYALATPGKMTAAEAHQTLAKIERLAGGLSDEEAELVCSALDHLLELEGRKPIFREKEHTRSPSSSSAPPGPDKPGRNDPCPCGSGKKYKKCCGA